MVEATTVAEVRAKLADIEQQVRETGQQSSTVLSERELALIVQMELGDALKALGTSRRVLKARALLVVAMNACRALTGEKGAARD